MLYAPWRDKYSNARSDQKERNKGVCVFCVIWEKKERDEELFVLARYSCTMVLLNRYPYAGGHLLVVPKDHKSDLSELSSDSRIQLIELLSESTEILKQSLCAMGVNVGINIGKAAGAGIPGHLHVHLVPRWEGDTNFLPVIGKVKQVSVDLERIYKKLRTPFQEL